MRRFLGGVRGVLTCWRGVYTPVSSMGGVPPNQPATPTHTIRVDDELWQAVVRKAHERGETLTDVVIRALRAYLRD